MVWAILVWTNLVGEGHFGMDKLSYSDNMYCSSGLLSHGKLDKLVNWSVQESINKNNQISVDLQGSNFSSQTYHDYFNLHIYSSMCVRASISHTLAP